MPDAQDRVASLAPTSMRPLSLRGRLAVLLYCIFPAPSAAQPATIPVIAGVPATIPVADRRRFTSKPRVSQGGQHHTLRRLFAALGTTNRYYVEFGFNPGEQCRGSGPNSCSLWLNGWDGLLLDGSFHNASINLHSHFITSANIVSLFRKHGVPAQPDYVSIDVDSADLWIMRALLASVYRPRVLSIEFNSNFPWGYPLAFPDPTTMAVNAEGRFYSRGTCYMGASAMAIENLGAAWGYVTVAMNSPLDLFLVPRELAEAHGLRSILPRLRRDAHLLAEHHPMTTTQATNLVDYTRWQSLTDDGSLTGKEIVRDARASAQRLLANLTARSRTEPKLRCFSQLQPPRRGWLWG